MARSSVTLKQYMFEIRHEIDQVKKSDMFPDGLLFKWIHKDILETVLRLGPALNQAYRAVAQLTVTDGAGAYEATASHSASATSVTGFTGLTPDGWIGGSVITVVSDVPYSAQITDNDATTLTISSGSDLPVMSDDPVFILSNNAKKYLSLSSLSMLEYEEPIWELVDSNDNPIEQITSDEARNIPNDPMNANEAYWFREGENIRLVLGSDKTLSGNLKVGYYIQPVEATALTDVIDFPAEYHDLAQQRTMIRVLKKLDQYDRAQEKEVDLEKRWQEIEKSNIMAFQRDVKSNERKNRP